MTFQSFRVSLNSHLTIPCSAIITNKSYCLDHLLSARQHDVWVPHTTALKLFNNNASQVLLFMFFRWARGGFRWVRKVSSDPTVRWRKKQTQSRLILYRLHTFKTPHFHITSELSSHSFSQISFSVNNNMHLLSSIGICPEDVVSGYSKR